MKKSITVLTTIAALSFSCCLPKVMADWQKPIQPPASPSDLTFVCPHPLEPSKILAASRHQLFESNLQNGRWQTLWSEGISSSSVRRLLAFDFLPDQLFILATQYVLMGDLKTAHWQKIYDAKQAMGGNVLSFAVDPQNPNHWFLGTYSGLFESDTAGKTWNRSKHFPSRDPVYILLFAADQFFIGGANTLYILKSSKELRKSFALPEETASPEETMAASPVTENFALEDAVDITSPGALHDLIISPSNSKTLWLGTSKGVFESRDGGLSWHALSRSGLQSTVIRQLAYSEKSRQLYAATPRGIYAFSFSRQAWRELFRGLAQKDASGIALIQGNSESLAAITQEGLALFPISPEEVSLPEAFQPSADTLNLFRELIRLEPSPREVQKALIRYANVSNGKIKRWHAGSRLAGLLPTLSFGKDYSASNNIDLDRGGTSDPDRFIAGPYDTSKGWDARVGWDLGDAIYSSDQTSIDSREKLMVELRNDLLSEATRIYYERRRLQIDFFFSPPVSEQEHWDTLLRLEELTSLLDGMTDGFFVKKLENIYKSNPQFERLWGFERKNVG